MQLTGTKGMQDEAGLDGIVQDLNLLTNGTHAQTRISLRKWDAENSLGLWHKNEKSNQKTLY